MANKPNVLAVAQPNNPRFVTGKKTKTVEFQGTFTSANSAIGDQCVLAEGLSFSDRISAVRPSGAGTPALTSASNNDLGFFYRNVSGDLVALDADILWDGVTLATALTSPNLLTALNTSLDASKNIGQLLGLGSDHPANGNVCLVLTTNVANTAAGPLELRLFTDIDEATTQ